MLELTSRAGEAVQTAIVRAGKTGAGLRIMVEAGGCAGLKYMIGIDQDPRPDDHVVETSGVAVFIDPTSASHLMGLQVDFVEQIEGAGFVFNNPNAAKACSCGKSFGTC